MPLLLSYLASVSNQHLELSQLVKQRAPDFCRFLQHQKTSVLQATQLLRGLPDCCFFLLCFNDGNPSLSAFPLASFRCSEGAQFDRRLSEDFFGFASRLASKNYLVLWLTYFRSLHSELHKLPVVWFFRFSSIQSQIQVES